MSKAALTRYMLDTNILIYLLKNQPPGVAKHINKLPAETQIVMSFFTFAELLSGAERSSRKNAVIAQLDQLIREIPVVYPTNRRVCEHYAVQFSQLKARGKPIGANDLWIACHALAHDYVLVTNNEREFARIEGLRVENWV